MVMDNNCRKSFTTSEAWQGRLDHKKQNDLYGTYTSLTRHGLNICISLLNIVERRVLIYIVIAALFFTEVHFAIFDFTQA